MWKSGVELNKWAKQQKKQPKDNVEEEIWSRERNRKMEKRPRSGQDVVKT